MKNGGMIRERTSEEADRQLKTAFANSLKKSHYLQEINRRNNNAEDGGYSDKFKELDEQKDIFLSIMLHELQTPLTCIKGFTQLIMDSSADKIDSKNSHYLKVINKNTEKLFNIVMNVIASTKINLGKIKMHSKDIEIYSIISGVTRSMEHLFKDKKINFVFDIEKDLPKIIADPNKVIHILRNILMNAIQATESGGTISLKIYQKAKYVQFEVEDNGIGISQPNQKYIFKNFYQVSDSVTKQFAGSGLGLSICNGLIELMNGAIWFKSQLGKGSTFYFTLPIAGNTKKTASDHKIIAETKSEVRT